MSKIKRLTQEEKLEIVSKYKTGNYTCNQLGKEYKRPGETIVYWLKKYNIPIIDRSRKYNFNENYFDDIDSEEKAYFLGFLFADGNNSENRIVIGLQEQDVYILNKLAKCMNYTGNLQFVRKSKSDNNLKNMYYLRMCSVNLCKKMSELGCTPKKSLTLKFPNYISSKLLHHFIRGYFDGDGTVNFLHKQTHLNVGFVGTKQFVTKIVSYFNKNNIKFPKPYNTSKTNKNTYATTFNSRRKSIDFYNLIYKDATIFLTRKRDKFLKMIEVENEISRKKRLKSESVWSRGKK